MQKQVLQMKYHPAKKEIEFHRFKNGKEVAIRRNSKLRSYMNLKGKFVLQDHGNTFFQDIVSEFEDLKTVSMQVITTKMDYEDFEQMVELYNEETEGAKIQTTLLAELPDMKSTFVEVKKYGEQAINILQNHKESLFSIPFENESVQKSIDYFAKQIEKEIQTIKEKIDSLDDNNVSLCFTGVYSAGKSALINAILGYRILPEDIKSETAKMFQISSPKHGEKIKVQFKVSKDVFVLEWKEETESFEFAEGTADNTVRTEVQVIVDDVKEKELKQHEQINRILGDLNARKEVSSEIIVTFPVSLDNENVHFTIYDTPGTDSNYRSHQRVLNESLEEQTQSILIFVAKPDGLEGSGNNALLSYLKAVEEKSVKTSIDIGRSLFVINKADGQTSKVRMTLQNQEIKNKDDEEFSIKLEDKKLFFISALYAYAAKAVTKGIATPQENGLFEAGKYTLASEENPMGYCYRQNHCATSEYTTGKMLERCEEALSKAKEDEDAATILYICSGLYALESEIVQYGEKYASAVKTFAIIDSVDRALKKLGNRASSLKDSNNEAVQDIEASIAELEQTIQKAIEVEYKHTLISEKEKFPIATLKELYLDDESLNRKVIEKAKERIDKELRGWFFGLGKVRVKEGDKYIIREIISNVMESFTDIFLMRRKTVLEKQRDAFMNEVKNTIMGNKNVSDSSKKYIMDIPAPMVAQSNNVQDVGAIYDAHRRMDKIFVFQSEYLDKEGFIKDIEKCLLEVTGTMRDDYCDDYRKALEVLLQQIKSQYESNVAEYSLHMQAMFDNKEAIMKLGDKVTEVADSLKDCQGQLNEIIWKEIKQN